MIPTLLTAWLSFLLLSITTVSSSTVIRESCQNDVVAFVNHLALYGNLTTKVVEMATRRKCFNTTLSTETDRAKFACHISSMVFGSEYLDASSADYKNRTEVNWSEACWENAICIIQPHNTREVAQAMHIVTFTKSRFAVRSGGHNPNQGWASVDQTGLLIDTVNLDQIKLSPDNSILSIGPGNRFGAVYKALNGTGRTIIGGRVTDVGVGGFMLGGGMPMFSSLHGIAATNIHNFEVVLSNSSIVHANAAENPDLFWALKGGGANFGLVTRFDIDTVPDQKLWFEARIYNQSLNEQLLKAVTQYQTTTAESDKNAGLVFNIAPDSTLIGFVYAKPIVRPSAFNMFYNFTYISHFINSTIGYNYDLALSYADVSDLSPSRRMVVSVAHQPDLDAYKDTYSKFRSLAADATETYNGSLTYGIQPFSSSAVDQSNQNGGCPLGLKQIGQDWFTGVIQWKDSQDDDAALNTIQAMGNEMIASTARHGTALPLRFMNDANHAQNVLASYGPENLARLKAISHAYDKKQVFQHLQHNGFLLRNVQPPNTTATI